VQTIITLACKECKSRNYVSTRNRANQRDRLKLNKHCKKCGKHTSHEETR